MAHDDVLGREITTTTVAVPTALDGDTVITCIEETILNQHSVTALRVASVSVRTVVDHLHPTNGDISRLQGMNDPEGRTKQRDILDEDSLAFIEIDELRTQSVLRSENPFRTSPSLLVIHRDSILSILQ